jgi:5-formyltetrahydrofolate cyclo-ligase
VRIRRNALSLVEQNNAANSIAQKLRSLARIQGATHIAIYLANDAELSLQPFIHWCWQNNKQVYLPVIHPFSKGHLLFLHYNQHTLLIKNKFGIAEPKLDVNRVIPIEQLEVILTPLVAFDNSGARIGMGGGYYDRTLANWYSVYQQQLTARNKLNQLNERNELSEEAEKASSTIKVLKNYPIGIAHDCQLIAKVPSQLWDIPLPEIITPTQHYVSANN